MDDRNAAMARRLAERVEHLNATRGWPWQESGVESVALDDEARVTPYLGTGTGFIVLGHIDG